jgi:helix-turn-helix protein
MSNLLKMAVTETIRTLHRRGWSQRRIADELGINRETVARHLRRGDPQPKPANAPPGSTPTDGAPKPANASPGSTPASSSRLVAASLSLPLLRRPHETHRGNGSPTAHRR